MNIAVGIVVLLLSMACAVISVFQFRRKGFLFNNAYLYAGKREKEKMNKALPTVRRRICFFVGPVSLHCGRMYFENELAWVDFKRADRWCADLCDCFFRQGARKKVRRKSPTVFPFPLNGPAGGLSPFPLPLRLVTFLLFLVAIPIKRTVDLMLSTVRPPGGIASAGPLAFSFFRNHTMP